MIYVLRNAAAVVKVNRLYLHILDALPAGREREDGQQCWVAVTTAAYATQLLQEHGHITKQAPLYI